MCSELFLSAKEGKPEAAEEVLRTMLADGFQPGPRAYHALIFAYVKSGSASGALDVIRRAHSSGKASFMFLYLRSCVQKGAKPLTESYVILIHAFMKEQNLKTASAVFTSMSRPGADADREAGRLLFDERLDDDKSWQDGTC